MIITRQPTPDVSEEEEARRRAQVGDPGGFFLDIAPFVGSFREGKRLTSSFSKSSNLGKAIDSGLLALSITGDAFIIGGIGSRLARKLIVSVLPKTGSKVKKIKTLVVKLPKKKDVSPEDRRFLDEFLQERAFKQRERDIALGKVKETFSERIARMEAGIDARAKRIEAARLAGAREIKVTHDEVLQIEPIKKIKVVKLRTQVATKVATKDPGFDALTTLPKKKPRKAGDRTFRIEEAPARQRPPPSVQKSTKKPAKPKDKKNAARRGSGPSSRWSWPAVRLPNAVPGHG